MSGFKKTPNPLRPSNSYNSLYDNPLNELRQTRSSSSGSSTKGEALGVHLLQNKENVVPDKVERSNLCDKENVNWSSEVVKPSSLQLCIQKNEAESKIGLKMWEHTDAATPNSGNIWDYSDSEAAPASSWSTLPNRSLLYRPLPIDIGRCSCVIVKEASPDSRDGGTFYSLYTNEGHGRQNRKLAIAHHRRRGGKSEFIVAQNTKGIWGKSDDSLIGHLTANLLGSKYHIWDQGRPNSATKQSKLLGVVTFVPTIATWTGSYRRMKACIPKHQSMQLKSTAQHMNGLPTDWVEHMDKVNQLFSKIPHYSKVLRQYELDFRDRGRAGLKIQSSVKNFQLTMEKNGRQTILQLGRVGKDEYVMNYRYPVTGYQAFCMCLASIDSKWCRMLYMESLEHFSGHQVTDFAKCYSAVNLCSCLLSFSLACYVASRHENEPPNLVKVYSWSFFVI